MKYVVLLMITMLFSCKKESQKAVFKQFNHVEIKTVFKDSLVSIRAMEIMKNKDFVFATSNGKVGLGIEKLGKIWINYVSTHKQDTIVPNFRSVAFNGKSVFALSIASPALLYKDGDLVYQEKNVKVFYDSMQFWNEVEGIAIGDPTDDCLSIIITRDAGENWQKISCENLPKIKNGEAAFAASNTNITIVEDNVWVATGGKHSRILFSADKGNTWEFYNTPIVQGVETTGMYSLDFYDALNGFAIGGDYTKPNDSTANKIKTVDGGKTWQIVGKNKSPGYRSCVQYVPNSNAKSLVAVGFKGIDATNDGGDNWKHLSDESFYTIRFVNDSIAYAAGNGRIVKLQFN